MTTNSDVESLIASDLQGILRKRGFLKEGYQCDVHLHRGNRRKRRNAEFDGNLDPDTDSMRIAFSLAEEDDIDEGDVVIVSREHSDGMAEDHLQDRLVDLVRALDHAERRPGYEFVSLKWFRDTALANEDFPWAADDLARRDALQEAIDRRWILTNKVPNPRSNFPTTAIRVNRLLPEVGAAFGKSGGGGPAFRPVAIRGESLSSTVLRDRR